jgi:dihydroorotase
LCLADGVTSLVDAGSAGADGIDAVVAVAKAAPNRMRVFINIGRKGIIPEGDLMDLANVDVAAARAAIERHRDVVVGIKARLSKNVAGSNDLEALKRAQSVARPLGIPIMIHMGQTVSPLPDLLAVLKPGDIVTHLERRRRTALTNQKVLRSSPTRKRGIWFDFETGASITSRGHRRARDPERVFFTRSRPIGRRRAPSCSTSQRCRSFAVGMPLDRVACATSTAAKTVPAFRNSALRVGAPAAVAVMDLQQGSFEFEANYKGKRTGRMKLVTTGAIFGGKRV